ncbi:putative penicillin-binding protein PbpX [compost metagenome]
MKSIFTIVYRQLLRLLMLLMIITVSLPSIPVHAQADPKAVDTAKIDKFMESAMSRLHIPGASLGIVKGTKAVYLKGYGVAGPDQGPVTPQTSFVLGSTTKSITALAIMQLAEAGRIDLNAPVQQYLPWFRLADADASKSVRVKDLLHQTSGLTEYDGRVSLTEGDKTIKEHLQDLSRVSPVRPAGAGYEYSNLNYNILSGIIEAVSGETYSEYVKDHIYMPLHMNSSYTSPQEANKTDLATGYQSLFGFMIPTQQLAHTGTVASGYLISSAEDLSHYMVAQMNQGRYEQSELLSAKGIKQMHEPAVSMGGGASYAMGWSLKNGVTFHTGATENTYSILVMNGEYGIILLVNAMDYLVSYDSIAVGISDILQGQEPVHAAVPLFAKTYMVADLLLLITLALIIRSFYVMFKWRSRYKSSALWLIWNTICILLFNLLIPIAVLLYVPKVFSAPWPVVRVFLPGLGHALFFIPILLLGLGVFKAVLMIRKESLRAGIK